MSLIFITHHDENIYNITKTETVSRKWEKAPAAVKKIHDTSKTSPQISIKDIEKKSHATMGLPCYDELPDPRHFLKKKTGKLSYSIIGKHEKGKLCRNLNLPFKNQTPLAKELLETFKLQEKQSNKNFIKENIETAKNLKPKTAEHKIVVDRIGTTILPEESGLQPVYIKREVFGKTPKYLVRFNQIKEKEYQLRKDTPGKQETKCRYIRRDEREELLKGLKQNWEELQKQYQGLPILTDTIPKKIRKSKLEAELKQIEKDIVLIERHPYIYVYNDEDIA